MGVRSAKITLEIARAMRRAYREEGVSARELSARHGIHVRKVYDVLAGVSWKEGG